MNEFLKTCLIVCPLVFLAGFVDSVAGGGGIISLPAYLMAGLPAHLAAGTNKVVNGCGTFSATVKYLRGGKVRVRAAVAAAAGALAGAAAGAQLASMISESVLKTIMLVALPCVAVFLVLKRDFGGEDREFTEPEPKREITVSALIGLGVGCYDGLLGPGTGTFMIICFTAFLSMDLLTASGCSKAANLASNLSSAVVWILHGSVMWKLALPALVFSILGNLCGARYALRGGSKKIRGMMFVVLGLLFAKMLYELLT
ncbi:MAG: TSUP family transporter [Oscillospiraceae bacterium]|nr:TSUP family transporter [Oscillospiraceae bacterium]